MNLTNQRVNLNVSTKIVTDAAPQAVAKSYLEALTARDFNALERIFLPTVRFRALVPSNEDYGSSAFEAVRYLRDWFGDEDTIEVLQSNFDMVQNVLSIQYRLRVHDSYGGWQVIEQHAYCRLQEGWIAEMRLVCSGFLNEPDNSKKSGSAAQPAPGPRLGGTLFYDAGAKGCAERTAGRYCPPMRQLNSGQTLEIHATNPSVAGDLPAWSRLSGHEIIQSQAEHFLIRHK